MVGSFKIAPLIFIVFAVLSRLVPHPPNFAPITALALFSGVYLPKKYAFIIPIVALLVSDYFVGYYGWEMFFVYGSFLISGMIGLWLRSHQGIITTAGSALASSLIFYLLTNFGVWLMPYSTYSNDIRGLMESYYLGYRFLEILS